MVVDKIITQKELNYIETLYVYANLESFITEEYTSKDFMLHDISQKELDAIYSEDKHRVMMSYIYDTMLCNAEFLGETKGRSWYRFENYRIVFMSYWSAKKANQFNVEIQYTQNPQRQP